MRTLLFVLFALVVSCSALAAAPEAEASTRSAINLAQSAPAAAPAGAAAPAKPFYDPLLMYNPYMCATPAAPAARTLASMHRPARELAAVLNSASSRGRPPRSALPPSPSAPSFTHPLTRHPRHEDH